MVFFFLIRLHFFSSFPLSFLSCLRHLVWNTAGVRLWCRRVGKNVEWSCFKVRQWHIQSLTSPTQVKYRNLLLNYYTKFPVWDYFTVLMRFCLKPELYANWHITAGEISWVCVSNFCNLDNIAHHPKDTMPRRFKRQNERYRFDWCGICVYLCVV